MRCHDAPCLRAGHGVENDGRGWCRGKNHGQRDPLPTLRGLAPQDHLPRGEGQLIQPPEACLSVDYSQLDIPNKPSRSRARVSFEGRSPEPGIHFRTSLAEARVSRGMAEPWNCVRRRRGASPRTGPSAVEGDGLRSPGFHPFSRHLGPSRGLAVVLIVVCGVSPLDVVGPLPGPGGCIDRCLRGFTPGRSWAPPGATRGGGDSSRRPGPLWGPRPSRAKPADNHPHSIRPPLGALPVEGETR